MFQLVSCGLFSRCLKPKTLPPPPPRPVGPWNEVERDTFRSLSSTIPLPIVKSMENNTVSKNKKGQGNNRCNQTGESGQKPQGDGAVWLVSLMNGASENI